MHKLITDQLLSNFSFFHFLSKLQKYGNVYRIFISLTICLYNNVKWELQCFHLTTNKTVLEVRKSIVNSLICILYKYSTLWSCSVNEAYQPLEFRCNCVYLLQNAFWSTYTGNNYYILKLYRFISLLFKDFYN